MKTLNGVRGTAEERLRKCTQREGDCLVWRRKNKRPIYMRDDGGHRRPIQYIAYRLWVDPDAEPGVPVVRACGDRRCVEPTHLLRGWEHERAKNSHAGRMHRSLTDDEVHLVRLMYDRYERGWTDLARRWGVNVGTLWRAAMRLTYQSVPEVGNEPRRVPRRRAA